MNEFVKHLSKEDQDEVNALENEETLPLKPNPLIEGLSQDQKNALDAILAWLNLYKGVRDENGFFALTGSAGTGKTTLLGVLLKMLPTSFRDSRVCICAPTHKAKKVLKQKTGWRNAETLQALLGMRPDTDLDDFDVNDPKFSIIGDRKIKDYDFVLVDEASMINSSLKTTIEEACRMTGTIVLYIGDTLQLNPVKEYSISLTLTTPIHRYDLTQIMRQNKSNPLIVLLETIRQDIINETSTYKDLIMQKPENMNEKGEGYHAMSDRKAYADKITSAFKSEEFVTNKDHCRHISWTNGSIVETSKWLRTSAYGYVSTLEKGEILLAYKTYSEDDGGTIIVNSDDYIIEDVKDSIISTYAYPLIVNDVKLRCIDTGETSHVYILVRDAENYKNYISVYDTFLQKAKVQRGKAWPRFYKFEGEILIMDEMIYFDALKKKEKIKKKIDYGYGITAHKSQGSTYHTVFVNYKDISNIVVFEKDDKRAAELMKKRLLYVALSRASNEAYLYYNL